MSNKLTGLKILIEDGHHILILVSDTEIKKITDEWLSAWSSGKHIILRGVSSTEQAGETFNWFARTDKTLAMHTVVIKFGSGPAGATTAHSYNMSGY